MLIIQISQSLLCRNDNVQKYKSGSKIVCQYPELMSDATDIRVTVKKIAVPVISCSLQLDYKFHINLQLTWNSQALIKLLTDC